MLIGMDSFFYFIEDADSNALVLKKIPYKPESSELDQSMEELLKQILMQEKMLQLPYAAVSICYSGSRFTIVPEEVYSKHQLKDYLTQITRIGKKDEVAVCSLASLESHLVYSIEKVILDIAKSYFPGAKHLHIVAPLVMQAYQHAKSQKGHQVFVHAGANIMGIFLFKQDKLLFANTFPYQTEQDFLYNVLLVFDQFELDTERIPMMMTGRIQKKSSLYEKIEKYIRHIHILHSPSYYFYGPAFQNANFHYYHDLLSMRLCE
jgi:hypothetical protein